MQSTSWETLGWKKHKLESSLLGEMSIASEMHMTPPLWQKVKWSEVKSLSCVWLFATPWTVAYQAPPSMGFSRQECWSRLPFPSPEDFLDPGIKPLSPTLKGRLFTAEPPGKPPCRNLSFLTSTELQDNISEHSHTHQQKIGLKIYWTWPHPSEQGPVSLHSVSPIRKLP